MGAFLPLQGLPGSYISIISLSCTSPARLRAGGRHRRPGHLQHNHQRELPELPAALAHPGPSCLPRLPSCPSRHAAFSQKDNFVQHNVYVIMINENTKIHITKRSHVAITHVKYTFFGQLFFSDSYTTGFFSKPFSVMLNFRSQLNNQVQ